MAAITSTDAPLLALIWLASPALPVGGFSYSEGLEAAVDSQRVTGEASAADWLVDQLHLTLARADMPAIAAAVRDPALAPALDAWIRRTRETAEFRLQAEQMGRSLGEWRKSLGGTPSGDFTYPIAFALAARESGAAARDILLAFAFGWSENLMQAAIKSVPLGQGAGQRILARLAREIPLAVDRALATEDEDRQSFAPMLAILSSQHEVQYSRLFRS